MRFNFKLTSFITAMVTALVMFTLMSSFAYADDDTVFSVAVPTSIPIYMDEDGNVTCSNNLEIVNNASCPIAVTNIEVRAINGWTLTDEYFDRRSEKVDLKKFMLSFCGCTVPRCGSADISRIPALEGYGRYTIDYDAYVSTVSDARNEEIIGECIFTVGYQVGRLKGIYVLKAPDKTTYFTGESFDASGMIVMASYYGLEDTQIGNYEVEDASNLSYGRTSVSIMYEEDGITKRTILPIEVVRTVSSIELYRAPDKTSYVSGENFDPSGMSIKVNYTDGTSETVGSFTYSPEVLRYGDTEVAVSFEAGGCARQISVPVSVRRILSSLEIGAQPAKTTYCPGEQFSPSGAAVTARYEDGTSADVTNYVNWSRGTLSADDSYVIATYSEGGITRSAHVRISVQSRELRLIELVSPPSKTEYFIYQNFDPSGIEIDALYSNGERVNISDYVNYSKGVLLPGDTSVTAVYEEGDVTKSIQIPVSVTKRLSRIYVSVPPAKTSYASGESFSRGGMVVKAVYEGGYECEITSYTTSFDNTPFTFVLPPSTVQIYYTVRDVEFVSQVANAFGIPEADLRAWNNFGNLAYISPKGSPVYVSDPSLDASLTCTYNDVSVYVYYTEDGVSAQTSTPVRVLRP